MVEIKYNQEDIITNETINDGFFAKGYFLDSLVYEKYSDEPADTLSMQNKAEESIKMARRKKSV